MVEPQLSQPFTIPALNEPSEWATALPPFTPLEVFQAKNLLGRKGLPLELIDQVIDLAEYWPVVKTCQTAQAPVVACAESDNSYNASVLYLRTLPLPGNFRPEGVGEGEGESKDEGAEGLGELARVWLIRGLRKVTFRMVSRDQGWSSNPGRGTYSGAYSWIAVFAERPSAISVVRAATLLETELDISTDHSTTNGAPTRDPPHRDWNRVTAHVEAPDGSTATKEPKSTWDVQCNVHAEETWGYHEVTWRAADPTQGEVVWPEAGAYPGRDFVRALRPGDRINMVMRAKYPRWTNEVRKMEVLVYYAV